MKVLIIKMSSMGDVIHTLPAITDAKKHHPHIQFDWLVEESFAEIPTLHANVQNVIAIRLRHWRKNWLKALKSGEPQHCLRALKAANYDLVIDAQGLFKSAIISFFLKKPTHGYNQKSIREPLAALFYKHRYSISKTLHAVTRIRQLFAHALNYPCNTTAPDYHLKLPITQSPLSIERPYLLFLHNTTWETKHWPELYWQQLTEIAIKAGFAIVLTSGNKQEFARACRIKGKHKNAYALERQSIKNIMHIIQKAAFVVSVDTGFAQLTAALNIPNVSLFGPTNPQLSQPFGQNQYPLSSQLKCAPCLKKRCRHQEANKDITPPCFIELSPKIVWEKIKAQLKINASSAM